ncbi:MAG: hypothetical protein HKO64_05760 [Xanthomonadales bacterium]|nr:M50 family metallopeptidase [Gammaproteobacteria bacterium]NNE05546.1 hypothetical protein [Xanthomonadales bacterium]NNL95109.1 hypothetical protein [Xanthomonadales bacterium]
MLLLIILFTIFITTFRHEGAHALAAWLQGVPINDMKLLPGIHPELGFYFGYVSRGDGGNWIIDAAPYAAAILWFVFFSPIYRRTVRHSKWRLPLFAVGIVSPIADLAYNYQGGLWREGTDVWDLLQALPAPVVHAAYLVAIFWMISYARNMGAVTRTNVTADRR